MAFSSESLHGKYDGLLAKGGTGMSRFSRIGLCAIFLLPPAAHAQPEYVPSAHATGTLRVWGSAQMQELLRLWEAGFNRYQPDVRFDEGMKGTISAMGGLYAGAADLALLGREIWPEEELAYQQIIGSAPTGIEAALGSFDVPTKADALMIFVSRDNPLSEIRFDQLAAVFGCSDHGTPIWAEAALPANWESSQFMPTAIRPTTERESSSAT